jgi:hypothetical protein
VRFFVVVFFFFKIIGDLQHVHALSVQLLLASKNHADIAFVTDNILEQKPNRTAVYGGRPVRVRDDGKARHLFSFYLYVCLPPFAHVGCYFGRRQWHNLW